MTLGALTQVPGIRVGSAQVLGEGAASGVTVVLPPEGSIVSVDSRGGGPATHETDILAPGTLIPGADAIVLTGGSALGLASAAGVSEALLTIGAGYPVPDTDLVVPIVPAAAIFDLGRGADASQYPGPECAARAFHNAGVAVLRGNEGAGTGALMGGGLLKGGQGTACVRTPGGHLVGALAVVNPVGMPADARGRLHAASYPTAGPTIPPPLPEESARWREHLSATPPPRGRHTTIGVVATDAALDSGLTKRLAGSAHAGLARAIHPSHTLGDGDTIFSIAPGAGAPVDESELLALGIAAADAFMLAIVDATLSATPRAGFAPSYSELIPSVAARLG